MLKLTSIPPPAHSFEISNHNAGRWLLRAVHATFPSLGITDGRLELGGAQSPSSPPASLSSPTPKSLGFGSSVRACYCWLQPRQMWLQKILMRSAEMPAVLELCWNNPCCPERPPGLLCDRKATAPGLPLVLETLSCITILCF